MKRIMTLIFAGLLLVSLAGATTVVGDFKEGSDNWLVVGDKKFGNFSCGVSTNVAGFDCDDVYGWTIGAAAGLPVGFTVVSPSLIVGPSGFINVAFSYEVYSLLGETIVGIHNIISPSVTNGGYVKIGEIAEEIGNTSNNAFSTVEFGAGVGDSSDPDPEVADFLTLDEGAAQGVRVRKDILVIGNGCFITELCKEGVGGGLAAITNFTQRFDQNRDIDEVPEPGTYALMGAGLLSLALYRRRRA